MREEVKEEVREAGPGRRDSGSSCTMMSEGLASRQEGEGTQSGRVEPTPVAMQVTLGKQLRHDGNSGTTSCLCGDGQGWDFWGLLNLPSTSPQATPRQRGPQNT